MARAPRNCSLSTGGLHGDEPQAGRAAGTLHGLHGLHELHWLPALPALILAVPHNKKGAPRPCGRGVPGIHFVAVAAYPALWPGLKMQEAFT